MDKGDNKENKNKYAGFEDEELLNQQPLLNKVTSKRHKQQVDYENYDDDEEESKIYSIQCLKVDYVKRTLLLPFLILITGGFIGLFLYWYVSLRVKILYSRCQYARATHFLILGFGKYLSAQTQANSLSIVDLYDKTEVVSAIKDNSMRNVLNLEQKYIEKQKFIPHQFDTNMTFRQVRSKYSQGIKDPTHFDLHQLYYGKCNIEIPMQSIPVILIKEVLNPFYIFQIFAMALWFWDGYVYYATAIAITSVLSIITSLVDMRRNLKNLQKMSKFDCLVNVLRGNGSVNGTFKEMLSSELVPGDIFEVPSNQKLPCDAILLQGSCIINESMLTGESVPVIKGELPETEDIYHPEKDKKYTLYGGTHVIQTRFFGAQKVLALVVRTGFLTIKGSLVRSILFPKPNKFRFYQDSLKFIGVMACLTIIGFIFTIPSFLEAGIDTEVIVDRSLDLITITVPPALPAAMTIGTVFAISRLRKDKIFCISPPRVNVCGRISIMAFDKTGTLTEDGLHVFGFRSTRQIEAKIESKNETLYQNFQQNLSNSQPSDPTWFQQSEEYSRLKDDPGVLYIEGLASCHCITRVENEFIGDPLDIKMFEATNWELEEPENGENFDEIVHATVKPEQIQKKASKNQDGMSSETDFDSKLYALAILRRFDFSSALQRMSVITRNIKDQSIRTYVKGSPEMIRELSRPETIPANFHEVLQTYTECGYRVIALGTKKLTMKYQKLQKCSREEIECDLQFLGLLIMQNQLKPATNGIIKVLKKANLKVVMATGDNGLTAISVGKECGILDGDHHVFLGELVEDKFGKEALKWSDVDRASHQLHPDNLTPNDSFYKDERGRPGSFAMDELAKTKTGGYDLDEESKANLSMAIQDKDVPIWEQYEHSNKNFSIAITGKAFHYICSHEEQTSTLQKVLLHAKVFARMSPDDKALLVEKLQCNGKFNVGMCGDGANDCSALKQADVGISLSEAEASIAAPFTSSINDISCVVRVLREGKAALVTSFQTFKFIELYSLIQFATVTLLYSQAINLADLQYFYVDLIILLPLCVFMGKTGPYDQLTHHMPAGALISVPVLVSVLGQVVIQIGFQFGIYFLVSSQPWYVKCIPPKEDRDDGYQCHMNTVSNLKLTLKMMFTYSNLQYFWTIIAFSISKPFRKPLYTNWWFCFSLLTLLALSLYILLQPAGFAAKILNLVDIPSQEFLYFCALIGAANFALTYLYEDFVVNLVSEWWRKKKLNKMQMKNERQAQPVL